VNEEIAGYEQEWPANGLEVVDRCPVCGEGEREILHQGLRDQVFYCAPGEWTLYCCRGCCSAYLDPRPTAETIYLAYRKYYTHQLAGDFHSLTLPAKVRRTPANGFRNWRYGTQDCPSNYLGVLIAYLMPNGRAIIDAGMRHLPKLEQGRHLLDIGCGSGDFLLRAKSAGWQVIGLDFDPKAVEVAANKGLNVKLCRPDALDENSSQFDAITMAHVIEHVHNPLQMLKSCYHLLKPGGFLWIETPNLNSMGHVHYGRNWRGLEPPRHLTIFTETSLRAALKKSGFVEITEQAYRPLCASLFSASAAIAKGRDPYLANDIDKSMQYEIKKAERIAKNKPSTREFITFKAWKK
jgi:2-polyprenyl-3-methyl-5-hydroxy-6-metoxy-1,4-benzoquinol methylase